MSSSLNLIKREERKGPNSARFHCQFSLMTTWITAFTLLSTLNMTVSVRKSATEIPKGSLNGGKCRFLINEINFYPSGGAQFLELKRACESMPGKITKTSLKNFRIIFFTHDAKLIGTCQPGQKPPTEYATRKEKNTLFYTIGGPEISTRDMDIADCEFAHDTDYLAMNRIPTGIYPIAIALLYNADVNVISGVEMEKDLLTNKRKMTHIRFSMEQVILRNLQDLCIIVSSTPHTGCKYFQKYYAGYTMESNSFLRDWGQEFDGVQRSLSRCKTTDVNLVATDWAPFEAHSFLFTKSTPGSNNVCEAGIRFTIEESQPKRKKPRMDFSDEYACQVSTEDTAIETFNIITNPLSYQMRLNDAIAESTQSWNRLGQSNVYGEVSAASHVDYTDYFSPITQEASDESSHQTPQINEKMQVMPANPVPPIVPSHVSATSPTLVQTSATQENSCKAPLPISSQEFEDFLHIGSPFVWNDCSRFQPKEFLNAIRAEPLNAPIKREFINDPAVCSWLEWIPQTKKFRCKWCNKLWNQRVVFDSNVHITKVIRDSQGYSKGTQAKFDNKKMLQKHKTSDLHKLSEEYLHLYDSGKRGDDLTSSFEAMDGPYRKFLNKTENRFVSIFQAIKLDLPFLKYPMLSELMDFYGVNMGTLYNTRDGMKLISMAISDKYHGDFCNFLKTQRPEISILIDTSSDVSSSQSLAIIFQTFDVNQNAGTIFYRLLHVKKRETTENLFEILVQALTDDGLMDYVKEKMVGFGTDGGSNVRGMKDLLNKITVNDLVYVYCHAHRLERAVKHAWDAEKILTDADSLVNSLYTTFNSRSPKKKLVMQQQIKELGDSRFELKPIKQIRWVNSKKRATETIVRHWKTIVLALQSIQKDKTFPSKQRSSAELLEGRLCDPSMVAALVFVADASQQLAKISLNLQKYGATLIGKKGTREEIKNGLRSLESGQGENMKWLLSTPQVQGRSTKGVKLVDFDTQVTEIDGVTMKLSSTPRMGDILSAYIESIVREIDISFPEDVTDLFDIFNPKAWPQQASDEFGNAELLKMNSGLTWNYVPDDFLEHWKSLKRNIATSEDFEMLKGKTPEVFWSSYLQRINLWTPDLHDVISKVLTIPASTAEVERIYSHYTSTKTMRRYNLDVASVEAIIRIKVNGEKNVQDFARRAHAFVKDFIIKGHLRSDDRPERDSQSESQQCTVLEDVITTINSGPEYDSDVDSDYDDTEDSLSSISASEESAGTAL